MENSIFSLSRRNTAEPGIKPHPKGTRQAKACSTGGSRRDRAALAGVGFVAFDPKRSLQLTLCDTRRITFHGDFDVKNKFCNKHLFLSGAQQRDEVGGRDSPRSILASYQG